MFVGIAAVNHWGVIGKNGDMPWRHKTDFKHFKETTMGSICLHGRKSWESIPNGLLGRTNWIMTGNPTEENHFGSIEDVIQEYHRNHEGKTVFVCGGSQIYEQCFDLIDKWIVTSIPDWVEIDDSVTFMPQQYLKGFSLDSIRTLECGLLKTYIYNRKCW